MKKIPPICLRSIMGLTSKNYDADIFLVGVTPRKSMNVSKSMTFSKQTPIYLYPNFNLQTQTLLQFKLVG